MVLYPESAPEDWREQLRLSGLQVAISPLHDKDTNPTGEPKKAHHHVILVYGSPTTYNNVKSLCDRLHQPIPQPLEQVRGYYRYLTHEDNPEKAQYSKSDIQTLNGFDIREFVELTKSEVVKAKREVLQLIRDNGIVEYADLIDILMDGGESTADMFDVASNNTLFFKAYLTSQWRRSSVARVQQLHDLAEGSTPPAAPGRPPENEEGRRPSGASAARRENREPPR